MSMSGIQELYQALRSGSCGLFACLDQYSKDSFERIALHPAELLLIVLKSFNTVCKFYLGEKRNKVGEKWYTFWFNKHNGVYIVLPKENSWKVQCCKKTALLLINFVFKLL